MKNLFYAAVFTAVLSSNNAYASIIESAPFLLEQMEENHRTTHTSIMSISEIVTKSLQETEPQELPLYMVAERAMKDEIKKNIIPLRNNTENLLIHYKNRLGESPIFYINPSFSNSK